MSDGAKQVAFGYVYAPDSPERDAWLAAHQRRTEMTDADIAYYNDKDRWVLVVEFDKPLTTDYWADGAPPYPERLAKVVMKDWEHDDQISTVQRGVGFDGDLRWEVTDDTCFTAYSDLIDSLVDVITAALMNTVPLKLTLERRE